MSYVTIKTLFHRGQYFSLDLNDKKNVTYSSARWHHMSIEEDSDCLPKCVTCCYMWPLCDPLHKDCPKSTNKTFCDDGNGLNLCCPIW